MTLFKMGMAGFAMLVVMGGCHGREGGNAGSDVPPGRPSLIAQLKAIHALLATGDKQKIAELFSFPVPDSVGNIYVDDSNYRKELDKDGGNMTRDVFLRYFGTIHSGLDLADYNRLFEELNVDSLLQKDTLEAEDDTANEPCVYFYRIQVEGDTLVRITYGVSAVNPNYSERVAKREAGIGAGRDSAGKGDGSTDTAAQRAGRGKDSVSKAGSARDSVADASADSTAQDDLYNEGACEHDIFWTYRFDGRKLHLIRHDAAD